MVLVEDGVPGNWVVEVGAPLAAGATVELVGAVDVEDVTATVGAGAFWEPGRRTENPIRAPAHPPKQPLHRQPTFRVVRHEQPQRTFEHAPFRH
jgi:hypothetical protein